MLCGQTTCVYVCGLSHRPASACGRDNSKMYLGPTRCAHLAHTHCDWQSYQMAVLAGCAGSLPGFLLPWSRIWGTFLTGATEGTLTHQAGVALTVREDLCGIDISCTRTYFLTSGKDLWRPAGVSLQLLSERCQECLLEAALPGLTRQIPATRVMPSCDGTLCAEHGTPHQVCITMRLQ
jgi:hypothetical protein